MIVTPKVVTERGKVVRDSEEQGSCLIARQELERLTERDMQGYSWSGITRASDIAHRPPLHIFKQLRSHGANKKAFLKTKCLLGRLSLFQRHPD